MKAMMSFVFYRRFISPVLFKSEHSILRCCLRKRSMAELLRSDSAQARSMIRTRDASGRETAQDLLHGIQQEEAQR
jgi:hypothetical protein